MLKGENVLLRPVKRSDISCFLQWFNDPEVTQYLTIYLPLTEMQEEKWVEELPARAGASVNLIIEVIENNIGKPIGTLGFNSINPKDQVATFGIVIGNKEYWNHGYGTEAARLMVRYGFEQMNLHRIASLVFAFNERSLRMHKKIGFIEEGCEREAVFKNGQFWDVINLGILRKEWEYVEKQRDGL
jgi:RimJ/RimL family protein N-acetyltransferase